jgi:hypothetical protein
MGDSPLAKWLRTITIYLSTRNLMRIIHIDCDPNTLNDPIPQVAAGFNWANVAPLDLEGDRVCRFLLLQNMAPYLVPSMSPLAHSSEIWRALLEVSQMSFWCVVWVRVMLVGSLWGRRYFQHLLHSLAWGLTYKVHTHTVLSMSDQGSM